MVGEISGGGEAAVTYDHLTGLPDRAFFMSNLESAIVSTPGDFGVIFVDFDGLKAANDSGGHQAGDKLLQTGATLLAREFRLDKDDDDALPDVVARIGGDEIGVIVRNVAGSLLLHMVATRAQADLDAQGVRISVGATLHKPGETAADLLGRADDAMYENKNFRRMSGLTASQIGAIATIEEIAEKFKLDLRLVAAVVEGFKKSRNLGS